MKIVSFPASPSAIHFGIPPHQSSIAQPGMLAAPPGVWHVPFGVLFPSAVNNAIPNRVDDAGKDLVVELLDLSGVNGANLLQAAGVRSSVSLSSYHSLAKPAGANAPELIDSILKAGNLAFGFQHPPPAFEGCSVVLNAAKFLDSDFRSAMSPVELKIDVARVVLQIVSIAAGQFGYPHAATMATGGSLLLSAGKFSYLLHLPPQSIVAE